MPDFIHREKILAYLLRHDYENYDFDIHAWREIRDIVENHGYTREEILFIVANSSKQRFELSEDGLWVRALYGHSFEVDLQREPTVPPECLFHGTVLASVPSIMEKGLLPMNRYRVHLSSDQDTAMEVGARRKGEVVVLKVEALRMWGDGHLFWPAKDKVWLVKSVPPEYISTSASFAERK